MLVEQPLSLSGSDKDGKRAFKVYSRSYGIYKFVSELHNYIIILFLDAHMTSESLLLGVAGAVPQTASSLNN